MTDILVSDFIFLLLVFMRIIALLFSAPIFSNQAFPAIARIFFAALLSYIIFLTIGEQKIHIEPDMFIIALLGIKEFITGMIIGFALNFVFYGISFAGVLIGFDMGLSMATVFNPLEESTSNVIGEILYILALMVFIMINGHHYIITAIVSSFDIIPIGKFSITAPAYSLIIKYSAAIFIIAVKIASPIMISFFLVHLGEGIIARVIPQMNVFFVAQPIAIGLGLFLLVIVIPIYTFFIKHLLKGYEENLYQLIKAMGV